MLAAVRAKSYAEYDYERRHDEDGGDSYGSGGDFPEEMLGEESLADLRQGQ